MIDTQQTGSPGWWLERLFKRLVAERPRYELLDQHYRNEAAVPVTASKEVRRAYRRLMEIARANYAELIVGAMVPRIQPTGFRTGGDSDDLGDREAWRIWQANSLDANSNVVLRSSLTMGDAYVIVGGVDEEIGAPLITPEDPREVITEHDPRRRGKVRAALKVFTDDVEGLDWAYLYLPGLVFKANRATKSGSTANWDSGAWTWAENTPEQLPAKVVPVVRFANRCDSFGRAWGEYERHLPLLNRITYGILNRLEIVTLQAFRQRAIEGDLPQRDAQGNEIDYDDIFAADPGALWQLGPTAKIWESGQVDLGPIHTAGRDDVMELAAVTFTPLYYLTPDAANGSAEGASLTREGLVFKSDGYIDETGSESWESAMSLAFLFAGDEVRARRSDMECLWRPTERFSLAERADAAAKAIAGGVPWRSAMRNIWQFSPQEIDRMEAERVTDAFLTTPIPPVPTGAAEPATDAPVG